MSLWFAVIGALLILALLIFVHELGHYLLAKKNGIRVEAFAVGFGPTLFSKEYAGTVFSLKLIPLGGYVKLFGEDATDKKFLKAKDSFIAKTAWQRFQVLIAGVAVNFVVGFLLFCFAFWFNVPPLVTSQEALIDKVIAGEAVQSPGFVVEKGTNEIPTGSQLIKIEDEMLTVDNIGSFIEGSQLVFTGTLNFLTPNGETVELLVDPEGENLKDLGIKMAAPLVLPRAEVVQKYTDVFEIGDILLKVNSVPLVGREELMAFNLAEGDLKFEVLRGAEVIEIAVNTDELMSDSATEVLSVYVSEVADDSAAEKANLDGSFFIKEINNQPVLGAEDAIKMLAEAGESVDLLIRELGQFDDKTVTLTREPGELFGLYLGDSFTLSNTGVYISMTPFLGSLSFTDSEYPSFLYTPVAALTYTGEVSWLTLSGFANVVIEFVTSFAVPDEIGGPVAVTQITTQFIQNDAPALLWLVGIVSITLAVMNLLPIPALDGGRILFVLIEVVRGGKRVSQKLEAVVHMVGFVLLLGLIIAVSYNDVARLF